MYNLQYFIHDTRVLAKHMLETRAAIRIRIIERGDYYKYFVKSFNEKNNSGKASLIALGEVYCMMSGFIPHSNKKYGKVKNEH